MQGGHQLGHAGHLDTPRNDSADYRANCNHRHEPLIACYLWAKDCGKNGQRHADDAKPDGALGTFLVGETAQGQNEQDAGGDIDCCNDI